MPYGSPQLPRHRSRPRPRRRPAHPPGGTAAAGPAGAHRGRGVRPAVGLRGRRPRAPPRRSRGARRGTPDYDVAAATARTEAITFPGGTGSMSGAFAAAQNPKGAVLVVHENRGLTDHIRAVTGRLAGDGYTALAPGPALPRGRHRGRCRRHRRARRHQRGRPRRRPAQRPRRAGPPRLRRHPGRGRVLLRRRHGVAAAELGPHRARRRGAVLRARARRPQRSPAPRPPCSASSPSRTTG